MLDSACLLAAPIRCMPSQAHEGERVLQEQAKKERGGRSVQYTNTYHEVHQSSPHCGLSQDKWQLQDQLRQRKAPAGAAKQAQRMGASVPRKACQPSPFFLSVVRDCVTPQALPLQTLSKTRASSTSDLPLKEQQAHCLTRMQGIVSLSKPGNEHSPCRVEAGIPLLVVHWQSVNEHCGCREGTHQPTQPRQAGQWLERNGCVAAGHPSCSL